MTTISPMSPVVRQTAACYRRRELVVELHPGYLVMRQKGTRKARYTVSYDAVFELGAKIQARIDQAERGARKRAAGQAAGRRLKRG